MNNEFLLDKLDVNAVFRLILESISLAPFSFLSEELTQPVAYEDERMNFGLPAVREWDPINFWHTTGLASTQEGSSPSPALRSNVAVGGDEDMWQSVLGYVLGRPPRFIQAPRPDDTLVPTLH